MKEPTNEPARTPHVSRFFMVFISASLKKQSIIFTGCITVEKNRCYIHPVKIL